MAVNFPDNPSNGDTTVVNGVTYTYNATNNLWKAGSSSSSGGGGGTTAYATAAELPQTATNGDLALVEETDKLYIWNDTAWYNIALINTAPNITQGGAGSYNLATDGTPTVITLTATDPESLPVTWSYTVTSGSLTNGGGTTATVTQADNVFTITPTTTEAYAGEFTLTFSVTDGANIVNDVNSFTLVFATTIDESESVLALITTNGTTGYNTLSGAIDSSASSSSITNTNVQFQTYSPYRSGGYSAHFNGTDAALTVPASTSLQFETGDFTVEAWIYTDHSDFFGIWQNSPIQSGANSNYYFMGVGTDGSVQFYQHSGGPGFLTSAGEVLANTWTHIAFTRYNGTCYIYVNGVEQASSGVWDGYNFNLSSDNTIGYRVTPNYASGYITDLRIVKGTAVYTSAFTPPTEPLTAIAGTELLACQLPYWGDSSTNDHTITPSGSPRTSPFTLWEKDNYDPELHGGSMRFNDNQYLQGSTNATIGTGDFTIECWVTMDASILTGSTDYEGIWQISTNANGYSTAINDTAALWWRNQTLPTEWAIYGGAASTVRTGAYAASPDTWYHTAYVRSSGTSYIYINGKLIHSQADSVDYGAAYISIGTAYTNGYAWNGLISDFRVTDSAVYTADFTPPTEPLSSTNSTLHVKGTGAPVIDKSQSSVIAVNGGYADNGSYGGVGPKYAGTSIYNTSNNSLTGISFTLPEALDTDDFTIEGWLRWITNGSWDGCFFQIGDHTQSSGLILNLHNPNPVIRFGSSNTYVDNTTTLASNQWYHIAVTRESGVCKIWLDGQLEGSRSTPENITATTGYILSATYNNSGIVGHVEDFRITKGLARYTANFTPPTASLDG